MLIKSYQLGCEAGMIHIRRAVAPAATSQEQDELLASSKAARRELLRDCKYVTATDDTAATARRNARKEGWQRLAVEHRAYPGADYSNKVKYDVCPACAPKVLLAIAAMPSPPLPDIHCLACDASLTTEAGLWVDKRSGDHGGTYDHCPVALNKKHQPAR